MIEIGSDQDFDDTSMLGLQVDDSLTWQLDKIWVDNYD